MTSKTDYGLPHDWNYMSGAPENMDWVIYP